MILSLSFSAFSSVLLVNSYSFSSSHLPVCLTLKRTHIIFVCNNCAQLTWSFAQFKFINSRLNRNTILTVFKILSTQLIKSSLGGKIRFCRFTFVSVSINTDLHLVFLLNCGKYDQWRQNKNNQNGSFNEQRISAWTPSLDRVSVYFEWASVWSITDLNASLVNSVNVIE